MENKSFFPDEPEITRFFTPQGKALSLLIVGYNDFRTVKPFMLFRRQNFCTLHFVLSGKGRLRTDKREYLLRENDVFFLDDNTAFAYFPDEGDPWDYVWFSFDGTDAARLAGCDEFILNLPEGYDTVLTDEGAGISKGQRQLLAIARCFLSQADLVILDEATSDVDTETEEQIRAALERLRQGRTCFVIAHRLATVRNADQILVMSDGRVAEAGTHQELLAAGGLYARLYQAQF